MSVADELIKMARLRDTGVISEAEFQEIKARLLARAGQPAERGAGGHDPIAPMPENYMVWAVLATIFCAWPLGIVAIVKASKVQRLWFQGDYGAACNAGISAKNWAIASAVVGGIAIIIMASLAASGHYRF